MEKKGRTIKDEPEMISSPVSLFFAIGEGIGKLIPVPVTVPTMASGNKRSG
jgi:hypothetical protein